MIYELLPVVVGALLLVHLIGLPIPMGYERGKVEWLAWCNTGMHYHRVYWWGDGHGFQTLHPTEADGNE